MFKVFFYLDIVHLEFPEVRVKAVGKTLLLVTLILYLMVNRLIATFFLFFLLSWLNV